MKREELLRRASTYLRLTHNQKEYGQFLHINCHACGREVGRSGVYIPSIGKYMCYQPHCVFMKNPSYHDISQYLKVALGEKWYEQILEYEEDKNFLVGNRTYDYNSITFEPSEVKTRSTMLPECAIPIIDGSGSLADDARNYLISRGISIEEAWNRYRVHYVKDYTYDTKKYFGYVIFPFFDKTGKIIYYQGRDYTGQNKLRYVNPGKSELNVSKNTILFNEYEMYFYDRLYIVEGLFDAIEMSKQSPIETVKGLGIATLGMEVHDRQLHKIMRSPAKEIYVLGDDGAFLKWLEISYRMIGQGKKIYTLSLHQEVLPNGKVLKDCSDFGKERILMAAQTLPELTESHYELEKFHIQTINKYFYSGLQPLIIPQWQKTPT